MRYRIRSIFLSGASDFRADPECNRGQKKTFSATKARNETRSDPASAASGLLALASRANAVEASQPRQHGATATRPLPSPRSGALPFIDPAAQVEGRALARSEAGVGP